MKRGGNQTKRLFWMLLGLSILCIFSVLASSSAEMENKKWIIVEKNDSYNEGKFSIFSNSYDKMLYGASKLSEEEIRELKKDKSLIVREPFYVKIFLEDAVSIQNATTSWNLKHHQTNLTGQAQSVCVLDTGVDAGHPDLQGKIIAQHCFCASSDCCQNGLNEDTAATDDNGHGTHVAGIVAAQGNVLGIARQANLVVVKVMDSTGSGSEIDLADGIDWCISKSEDYNISVISLSLGTDCEQSPEWCYSNICTPSSNNFLQENINEAVAKNISIVVATGNYENYTHISWPACLPNVTRVASSDKSPEAVSYFSNRNSLVSLLGIGSLVNSTMPRYAVYLNSSQGYSLNYDEMSGTSMATPMVSGAIAIMNQYLKLSGQAKTPSQIETILNSTGKKIYDSLSARNYSRINAYSALLSLDIDNPGITISSPENNSTINVTYQNFSCNASDWQLKDITLKVYNSTGLFNQTSWNVSGSNNFTSINLTGLKLDEIYKWNYLVYDENNNFLQTSNYTLNTVNTNIHQIYPENDFYINKSEIELICNVSASNGTTLSNITFNIYNFTGLIGETSKNLSGTTNLTTLEYNLAREGNYIWNCVMEDNNSNIYPSSNRSLTYDATYPDILAVSSIPTRNAVSISWNTSEVTNASINLSNSIQNVLEFSNSHEKSISSLSSSTTYEFTIFYCDKANNCKMTETFNFTTLNAPSGGGGSMLIINTLNSTQLVSGQKLSLTKGSSIKFTLSNRNTHTLKVNSLSRNQSNITVFSEPINIILDTGEEIKLNLSNSNFYDFYLKLENISKSKANLVLREINESVYPSLPEENLSDSEEDFGKRVTIQEGSKENEKSSKIKPWLIATPIVLLLAVLFKIFRNKLIFSRKKAKKPSKS